MHVAWAEQLEHSRPDDPHADDELPLSQRPSAVQQPVHEVSQRTDGAVPHAVINRTVKPMVSRMARAVPHASKATQDSSRAVELRE